MKALLIVVFGTLSGGNSAITVMDSMTECEAALEAVLAQDWPRWQREDIARGSRCVPFPADNG